MHYDTLLESPASSAGVEDIWRTIFVPLVVVHEHQMHEMSLTWTLFSTGH